MFGRNTNFSPYLVTGNKDLRERASGDDDPGSSAAEAACCSDGANFSG